MIRQFFVLIIYLANLFKKKTFKVNTNNILMNINLYLVIMFEHFHHRNSCYFYYDDYML